MSEQTSQLTSLPSKGIVFAQFFTKTTNGYINCNPIMSSLFSGNLNKEPAMIPSVGL